MTDWPICGSGVKWNRLFVGLAREEGRASPTASLVFMGVDFDVFQTTGGKLTLPRGGILSLTFAGYLLSSILFEILDRLDKNDLVVLQYLNFLSKVIFSLIL